MGLLPSRLIFVAMRRYRIIFVLGAFALIAAVLIWLVATRPFGASPAISIGVLRYEPWAGGPAFKVWVGVTNTGRTPIRYSKFAFDPQGWMQVELQNGWTTRDLGPLASAGQRFPMFILGPGSNTTAYVALPEGTLRWRVGYKVRTVSLREGVTEWIPPKWRVRLRPLTERLSNKAAEHEIRSAVFECLHNEPPVVDGGIPARFSFEVPWPAAIEADRSASATR